MVPSRARNANSIRKPPETRTVIVGYVVHVFPVNTGTHLITWRSQSAAKIPGCFPPRGFLFYCRISLSVAPTINYVCHLYGRWWLVYSRRLRTCSIFELLNCRPRKKRPFVNAHRTNHFPPDFFSKCPQGKGQQKKRHGFFSV